MRIHKAPAWQSAVALFMLAGAVHASLGDRLHEFRDCLKVCQEANCGDDPTPIPFHRRLLLWDCPAECDYTCQHIITDARLAREPPYMQPVYQFHGKWPFYRFLGMQEPFSVIFSLFNYLAHAWGMTQIRENIPPSYPLRKYYLAFGYTGLVSWMFSIIFHMRDFNVTEKLDYFAAGAQVLYGMYMAAVRIFRLERKEPMRQSVLRVWTTTCVILYTLHVTYLTMWKWDYTYNMAANVAIGAVQNMLWGGFSFTQYKKVGRPWAMWPGFIVTWIVLAMSLELLDFPPWGGMLDAHSLWHLGTVGPTIWWYRFLLKDAQEDLSGTRLKE